jgi:hypothetical protein
MSAHGKKAAYRVRFAMESADAVSQRRRINPPFSFTCLLPVAPKRETLRYGGQYANDP